MLTFLLQQRDYAVFCYGLAFILLAAVCQVLGRFGRHSLPWGWLAAFALTRGLGEWMGLPEFILGDAPWLQMVEVGWLGISFACLVEFARLSLARQYTRVPGRWLVWCGLGLAAGGLLGGLAGLEVSLRLVLGLPGALGAAWVLWRAASRLREGFGWGQAAALCMASYGLVMLILGPWDRVVGVSSDLFRMSGLALQALGVGVVMGLLASLWLWAREVSPEEMDVYTLKVRRWLTWTMPAALMLLLGLGWVITQFLGTQAAREERTIAQHYLRQFNQLVTAEMEETQSIAQAMSGAPGVGPVLHSRNEATLGVANEVLDRYSRAFFGAVCYVMNARGITVASSNRNDPDSFVGKSYVFRPYFQQAIAGGFGRYLALGATSLERGLYASAPIRDRGGKIAGVAVVKRLIGGLESILYKDPLVFFIGPHGVIFLSSRPALVLKSLWPLSAEAQGELIASRQFGKGPFSAVLEQEPGESEAIRFQGKEWFSLRQPAALKGWSVVVMGARQHEVIHRLLGMGAALFLCLTAMGTFILWDTTLEGAARLGVTERVYQTVVEGAPDCIGLLDAEGSFLAINPQGLLYFGRPEEGIIGRDFAGMWPEGFRDTVAGAITRAAQGTMAVFEGEYHHPIGQPRSYQVILNPILETDGTVRRVVGIATDITERKRAEADLHYRLQFEGLITRISTEFINLRFEDIGIGISRALEAIGTFAEVDRAYVFQMHEEGRLASNTFEWCAPGIEAQADQLQGLVLDTELPWFAAKMRHLEVFHVPRVADLPPEADKEKWEFQRQDIQSLVVVPLVHQGTLVGFLGFDSVRQDMSWSDDTIILLKMVGDILVNALERRRVEEELHFDESRLEALVQLGQMQEAPIREIATFAMEEGVRLTRSTMGYLAFMDEDETTLSMYAWSRQALKECGIADKTFVAPVEQTGLWGEAVRQRRPVITNDYGAPGPFKRGYPEGHVKIRRHLNVPIFEGSRIVAVAGVGNKEEPYDEADVRQLTLLMDGMWKLMQRRRAEEGLAAEKERLGVTLSSIGDAVIATDMDGRIKLMNHVAEEFTGWSQAEVLDRPVDEVFQIIREDTGEVCVSPVKRILATGEPSSLTNHTRLLARDGRSRLIADSGAPIIDLNQRVIGAVLVFRDVTFKQKMEEELLKVEKLRSLGILAGGIAHDFNNILTGILGNISLALLDTAPDSGQGARLVEAEKASLRARDLVQQLLTFAKGGAPVKKLASLKEIVEESAGFALRGSQVRCEFSLAEDLWPVEVDEGQISQVVQNLVINATQAMPAGGVIKIGAENCRLGAQAGIPLVEGPYVEISIADQGIGIPGDYLPRIFDPYFSTKQQGSGLGLATVYSIIKNHEGHVTVTSQLGKGTTFTILLPASIQAALTPRPSRLEIYQGTGRVLVMDDEPMVRDIAARMLTYLGYEATLTTDGAEALEQYRQALAEGHGFAVVILDLTIPGGMGGMETLEKLKALDSGVKALVSSGYAEDAIMTHYRDHGFAGVLQKPYKVEDLSVVLHSLLTAPEAMDAVLETGRDAVIL